MEKPATSDLERVRGLAAARARWLGEQFGVTTAAGLAALDGAEVARRLAGERPPVPRAVVDGWIADAAALAEAGTDRAPVASFVVEFQGRDPDVRRISVHHVEADHTEVWPGADGDRLGGWMAQRLPPDPAPAVDPAPAADPAPAGTAAPPDVELVADVVEGVPPTLRCRWSVRPAPALPDGEWQLDLVLVPVAGGPRVRLPGGPLRVPRTPEADYRAELPIVADLPATPLRASVLLTFRPPGRPRALLARAADVGLLRAGEALSGLS